MKKIATIMALLLCAAQTRAFYMNPEIDQVSGGEGYQGTNASLDLGGALHFTPSFSSYHSDATNGTDFRTYSMRVGYDQSFWGLGLVGGVTPASVTNNYQNNFFGADAILSFAPGSGKVQRLKQYQEASYYSQLMPMFYPSAGLSGFDVGAGVVHYDQTDENVANTGTLGIGQTNIRGSAGAAFMDNLLTVDITKSVYSGDRDASAAPQVQIVQGLGILIPGFTDTSVDLKLAMGMVPMITPYISYVHTTFLGGERPSGAYIFGGSVNLEMLTVHAFYEYYNQVGAPVLSFIGVGAGLNFQ